MSSSPSPLECLSEELLGEILLFCDFASAVQCSQCVSKSLYNRIQQSSRLNHVWRWMYDRHYFSPLEKGVLVNNNNNNEDNTDYVVATRNRRRLLFNLLQTSKKNRYKRCFNLPNRYFHFKPMIPVDMLEGTDGDDDMIVDPPPVIYECDSFALTSTGTLGEIAILDPFDGRFSVLSDILSHCVLSDEAMMDQAMMKAADAISTVPRSRHFLDWKENEIAGHCFDESVRLNYSHRKDSSASCQELLSQEELLTFDVGPYFPDRQGHAVLSEEFDMSYVGVESKPILDLKDNSMKGIMIGLGRIISNLEDESIVASELIFWTKSLGGKDSQYGNKMVCRFPWSFSSVDFDPMNSRVFATWPHSDQESVNARTIAELSLIRWQGDKDDTEYFPEPTTNINCRHPVVAMAVDSIGQTLLVSTKGRAIEVWNVGSSSAPILCSVLAISKNLRERIEAYISTKVKDKWGNPTSRQRPSAAPVPVDPSPSTTSSQSAATTAASEQNTHTGNYVSDSTSEGQTDEETIAFSVLRRQPELSHFKSPPDAIFIPKHLSAEKAGFVTLQYNLEEGSSLLLWRKDGLNQDFQVVSLVNLPLSSQRKPRVTYDGNRLIVLGEDHIGMIILIYQVSNGNIIFPEESFLTGDTSGGVYNLTNPPQIRFANRVRHAALDGIHRLDYIHLTTNEQFIVVNTKAGNLLSEASFPFSEGLLVIDLKDSLKDRGTSHAVGAGVAWSMLGFL